MVPGAAGVARLSQANPSKVGDLVGTDHDAAREPRLVDERDPWPLSRVADDEPEQERDGAQDAEQLGILSTRSEEHTSELQSH